ncbi:MAG: UDP-4-amino-4,6-dideoxy-N-acetyl-beta-L-altrosamine N-acetyltransferase [Pirellulales bacterium]
MRLRELRHEDQDMLRAWRNQPDVAAYMYTDHQISEEEHARWFAAALADPRRRYWIFNHLGQDVGLGCFYDLDLKHRRTNSAFYLARTSARGRGAGAMAEYALMIEAFDRLQLNKVTCEVFEENRSVVKGHETFGFVQEGLLRQHVIKSGRPRNVVVMGVLRQDWLARRDEVSARITRIAERAERQETAC